MLGQRPIAEAVAAGDGAGGKSARRDGTNRGSDVGEAGAAPRSVDDSVRALLAALLCAGLYPQLAYVHAPPTKKGAASSTAVKLHVRAADRALSEPDAAAVVHPGSVNGQLDGGAWRSCYVAFHERASRPPRCTCATPRRCPLWR